MSAVPRASQILLVGQKIRQIRKSRHLTQADLASRIGVTQSDLSRMENGEYKVGLDTLFRILQVFELSMSNFFEEPAPESQASAGAAPAEDVKTSPDVPFEDWAAFADWMFVCRAAAAAELGPADKELVELKRILLRTRDEQTAFRAAYSAAWVYELS